MCSLGKESLAALQPRGAPEHACNSHADNSKIRWFHRLEPYDPTLENSPAPRGRNKLGSGNARSFQFGYGEAAVELRQGVPLSPELLRV